MFGLELLGACDSEVGDFPNMLATAAACIINDKWQCYPDAIFENIIRMYQASQTMSDLFFVDPFLWDDDAFSSQKLSKRTVVWLQAIPISSSERAFADKHSPYELRELFEKSQIDVFNINRLSAV
jgi:hypothetical protein